VKKLGLIVAIAVILLGAAVVTRNFNNGVITVDGVANSVIINESHAVIGWDATDEEIELVVTKFKQLRN